MKKIIMVMVLLSTTIFAEGKYGTGFHDFYDADTDITMSYIEDLDEMSLLTVMSDNEVWVQMSDMWQAYETDETTQVVFQKNGKSVFVADFNVMDTSMICIVGDDAKKIVQWFISEAAIRNKVDVYSVKLVADVTVTLDYFNISNLDEQLKARKN